MPIVNDPCPFCADKAIDLCPRCGNAKYVRRYEPSVVDRARPVVGKAILGICIVAALGVGALLLAVSAW